MSARCKVRPIYVVDCDHSPCHEVFEPDTDWGRRSESRARWAALAAGWQTRPASGKGSRTAPDYCPKHRTTA